MAKVEVETKGPRIDKLLMQLPIKLRAKSLKKAATEGGKAVLKRARQLVPVGDERHNPGAPALRKTLKQVVRGYDNDRRFVAVVGSTYPQGAHGHLVEEGHKVVVSRGERKGQAPLSGTAHVPGKKFLSTAADLTKVEQDNAVIGRLQELIAEAEQNAKR
jgi:hypothetical protein